MVSFQLSFNPSRHLLLPPIGSLFRRSRGVFSSSSKLLFLLFSLCFYLFGFCFQVLLSLSLSLNSQAEPQQQQQDSFAPFLR